MVEELLKTYDLFHCSTMSLGKVEIEIDYYSAKNVEIKITGIFDNEKTVKSYEFLVDKYYETFILPKIFQRFISKNVGLEYINGENFIEISKNGKAKLRIINAIEKHIMILDSLYNSFRKINDFSKENKLSFIDYSSSDLYMLTNIICDIAYYNTKFKKSAFIMDLRNYQTVEEEMNSKKDIRNGLVLNIAKFAIASTFNNIINWDDVLSKFHDDPVIAEIIDKFKKEDFKKTSIYTKALEYAEYESINSYVIKNNEEAFEEATVACINNINFFKEEYLTYWKERKIYYQTILETDKVLMCDNFINNYYLKEISDDGKSGLIESLKKLKKEHNENSFFQIFNEPIDTPMFFEEKNEYVIEELKLGALEQANILVELIKERDLLEKEAEGFAKEIINHNKEYDLLKKQSEEQAKMILSLQEENKKLQKMADETAKYLLDRNRLLEDEEELRKFSDTYPVKNQDVNKINNLMVAISEVKKIDFAVAHPTIMSYLTLLEEKIVTYLSTHKNIIKEIDTMKSIDKEEMYETKSVTELLSMIENAYDFSKILIKDGRKTLINFNPVDEDTYRLVLYSIKNDDDEENMMDVFFEDYQLTDDVIEKICDIFKEDAVIVASKVDALPYDRADYLVIDNVNNALKLMNCPKNLVDKFKKYM